MNSSLGQGQIIGFKKIEKYQLDTAIFVSVGTALSMGMPKVLKFEVKTRLSMKLL